MNNKKDTNIKDYDESWHQIDLELMVRWMFTEKLLKLHPTEDSFELTPKGIFMLKFMTCYSGLGYKDFAYASVKKFHDWIRSELDWSWMSWFPQEVEKKERDKDKEWKEKNR